MIELYRECHMTIKNGFHLEHCTIRHAPPDMTKTLQKLCQTIGKTSLLSAWEHTIKGSAVGYTCHNTAANAVLHNNYYSSILEVLQIYQLELQVDKCTNNKLDRKFSKYSSTISLRHIPRVHALMNTSITAFS